MRKQAEKIGPTDAYLWGIHRYEVEDWLAARDVPPERWPAIIAEAQRLLELSDIMMDAFESILEVALESSEQR